jgi:hypothetical protein
MFVEFLLPVFAFVIGKRNTTILEKLGLDRGDRGIRCPVCYWRPQKHDTWMCNPGCGHVWNTFDTRGCCPECNKQWHQTACLRCGEWSLHESWYERKHV